MAGSKKSKSSASRNPGVEAISYGIYNLSKSNPIFRGYEQTLLKYVDNQKVNDKLISLMKEKKINPKSLNQDQQAFLMKELSNYATSGDLFNEKGKQLALYLGITGQQKDEENSGLVAKIKNWFSEKQDSSSGIKYLNAAIDATEDLKDIFSKNQHYKKMPEIAKAVSTLEDLKALYPAVAVLKTHDWITDKQYNDLTSKVYKVAKETPKTIVKGIGAKLDESYKKIAALILGFFGALLIISNVRITGGVIGATGVAPNLAGIILIIASLSLLAFKFNKKKL